MKTIFFITSVLILVGVIAGPRIKDYMVNNIGKRDLQLEEAAFTLKAKDFVAEFTTKEADANKKYLEKPVVISGVITSVSDKEVILDDVVVCGFSTADFLLKVGQDVSVKGRVVGFDDLMGSVNMDQCSINN
ncbi:OB-fold protein [Flavobacterium sp.]|uniref:OB-fold protein n=1 Tax=Flavobacterium sp. TaxID=239 RepID=UPI003BE4F21C